MEKENLNFQESVIERSNDVPVLVDFWSPSCGPCLFLGPVLEKLAQESDGKWELIKVNTMFNQQLAMDWKISSIPAVKLFYKGEVINEFVGALPEGVLRKWLDQFLPNEYTEPLNKIMETVYSDRTLGLAQLRGFVNDHPEVSLGRIQLARQIMLQEPAKAVELVAPINEEELLHDNAINVRTIAELVQFSGEGSEAADHLSKSAAALKTENFEEAVNQAVEAVVVDKHHADDLPRRGTIALFQLFGLQHPLVQKYRKKFEMALA